MSLLELLASAAGLASGYLAARMSSTCSARMGRTQFWPRIRTVGRLLVAPDEQLDFVREYLALWPVLWRYLARNLVLTVVALMPIFLTWWLISLIAIRVTYPSAVFVHVEPSQPLTVEWPDRFALLNQRINLRPSQDRLETAVSLEQPVVFSLEEGELRCNTLIHKQVYASSWIRQLSFALLGFRTLSGQRPPGNLQWLLVQPDRGDNNVLWPYLSDWEFVFFVAIALGALIVPISRRTGRS